MADVVGYLANLMNTQAQTRLLESQAQDAQALAQERQMNLQQMRLNQANEQQRQRLILDYESGQVGTTFKGGQSVEADPLISGLTQEVQQSQQEVQNYRQLAQLMQQNNLPEQADAYNKQADAAMQKANGSLGQLRLAQKQFNSDLASAVGPFVDNPNEETFLQAWKGVSAVAPQALRDIPRVNGVPDWQSPKTMAVMKAIAAQGETREQQIADRDRAERILREKNNLDRETAKDAEEKKRNALKDDQEAALKRQQIEESKARTAKDVVQTADAMKLAAKESIKASDNFKDLKFDDTLDAFAGDVSARANRIVAQANRKGDDMGIDEARQQAISELAPYVKEKEGKKYEVMGVGIPGTEGPTTYTYKRGSASTLGKGSPQTQGDDIGLARKLNAAGIKFSVSNGKVTGEGGGRVRVSSKSQYDVLPSGTEFIGPDGKPWTKP
jgi:hypothetical protein